MAIVKVLKYGDEARALLVSGINKLADAVCSTLGARGSTVLIESSLHTGGLTVTKDGVTVANSVELEDATENLAVNLVRQASQLTALQASDGTTTAIVLCRALVVRAGELMKSHMNRVLIMRHLRKICDEILERLVKQSVGITSDNLRSVAIISANGDEKLGGLIADAYGRVGLNGSVLVEKSKTSHCYADVSDGMRIERGWSSKYFVNNVGKGECVLVNPYILVCDKEITKMAHIEHLVVPALTSKRPFLVIGNVSEDVLEAMNYNVMKGVLQFCHIGMPDIGYKGAETLSDIALMCGARYFSEGSGSSFEMMSVDDLGSVPKVVVGMEHSILFGGELSDEHKMRIDGRVTEIEGMIAEATAPKEVIRLKERIANLRNGVGVVYIGAVSDIEYKELRDRADDCVGAVACAISDGIVSGGGIALLGIMKGMTYGEDEEGRVAWHIMKSALEAPFRQILTNGGFVLSAEDMEKMGVDGMGFDASKGEIVNLIANGIIDPVLVTKRALENAVSVATTLLSTNCVITNARA